MGILDEAIRDHLALKRRGGTQEADLRRLEKEAFGPPSRPGESAPEGGVRVKDPEALKEGPPPEEPAEARPRDVAPPPGEEGEAEAGATPGGEGLFHDFAAEEGLVIPGADAAPPSPAEEKLDVEEPDVDVDEQEPDVGEPRPPAREASLDDTQPHDMESELGTVGEGPEPESAEGIDEDLELHLEDDEWEASTGLEEADSAEAGEPSEEGGGLELVEEEEEVELVEEEGELVDEPKADEGEQGDDVLEETPEFLRETPEHDRLWFEQRPPKDFDFDE